MTSRKEETPLDRYERLCKEKRISVFQPFVDQVRAGFLDFPLDRVRDQQLPPIIDCLKKVNNLCSLRISIGSLCDHKLDETASSSASSEGGRRRGTKPSRTTSATEDKAMASRFFRAVGDTIENSKDLKSFELINCPLTTAAARFIAKGLSSHTSLQRVYVIGCGVKDDAFCALIDALRESPSIIEISFERNAITDKSAERFYSLIHSHCLRRDHEFWAVGLRGDKIEPPGVRSICLKSNGIGIIGASQLSRALREDRWVRGIDVSDNRIPKDGIIDMLNAVGRHGDNETLQILDMSGNPSILEVTEEEWNEVKQDVPGLQKYFGPLHCIFMRPLGKRIKSRENRLRLMRMSAQIEALLAEKEKIENEKSDELSDDDGGGRTSSADRSTHPERYDAQDVESSAVEQHTMKSDGTRMELDEGEMEESKRVQSSSPSRKDERRRIEHKTVMEEKKDDHRIGAPIVGNGGTMSVEENEDGNASSTLEEVSRVDLETVTKEELVEILESTVQSFTKYMDYAQKEGIAKRERMRQEKEMRRVKKKKNGSERVGRKVSSHLTTKWKKKSQ